MTPDLLPELALLGGALLFLVQVPLKKPGPTMLKLIGPLGATCGAAAFAASILTLGAEATLFAGGYALTGFSQICKTLLTGILWVHLVCSGDLAGIRPRFRALHQSALFFSVFTMAALSSATGLVSLAAALILSGPCLALTALLREHPSGQASRNAGRRANGAFRRFLLFEGAAAGVTLCGMACLFVLGDGAALADIARAMRRENVPFRALGGFAAALVLPLLRMGLWPMQRLQPELCGLAARESGGPLATLPDLAGLIALLKLLPCLPPDHRHFMTMFFAVLGLLAMLSGNLHALAQHELKRLLGFCGIGRSGCTLLALAPLTPESPGLALYAAIVGALAMSAAWAGLAAAAREGDIAPSLDDLRGLAQAQPAPAFILCGAFLGLGGLPPPAGFTLILLTQAALFGSGHSLIAACMAFTAVLGLAPCLKVLRAVYGAGGADAATRFTRPGPLVFTIGVSLLLALLLLGILPEKCLEAACAALRGP